MWKLKNFNKAREWEILEKELENEGVKRGKFLSVRRSLSCLRSPRE
jgi:hypothetical protein